MGIVYHLSGKLYDYLDKKFEEKRYFAIREKMLKNIKGKILDAGCGTGRNFTHYSEESQVTAVDRAPEMLREARKRSTQSKAAISIQELNLTRLPFPDNTFDAVVATFVLCVMPEKVEKKALKELVRVTKKDGRLYFLEYVYSQKFFRKIFMKLTAWIPKILFGMKYNTTLKAIKEEKQLEVEKVEYVWEDVLRLIVSRKKK